MTIKESAAVLLAAAGLAAPCRAADAGALQRARETAASGSEARALAITIEALKDPAPDRELYLYAVELLPERRSRDSAFLASYAARMLAAKDEDYAWYLGICKSQRVSGKAQEAVSNCKKALELDPTAYPVYRELGFTYAAAGSPRKAAETLEQGVEIAPESYQARYNLARALENRGDTARASAWYAKGLALTARSSSLDAGYYKALMKAGQKRCADRSRAKPAVRKTAAAPAAASAELSPSRRQKADDCAARVKEEYLKDNLGEALEISEGCLKLAPSDAALAAERAPIMVRLGRYEDGVAEYERAAGLYAGDKRMAAFCRAKAGDTWMKLSDPARAEAQYRLALAASPRDVDALKGLASAQEARSDTTGALATYEELLKADPGNEKARLRREQMRSSALTDEQVLAELKARFAVDDKKASALPEDLALFKDIRAAETGGGIDYLRAKAPTMRGLSVEREEKDGTRVLMTGLGYKTYVSLATRDAVRFFEKEGVGMREIFQLRDESGAALFDKTGRLTREGEALWRKAVPGSKKWLMPYDPVPESPQAKASKEAEGKIAALAAKGYQEISEPEFLWLLTATTCTEDVMMDYPVNMQKIFDGRRLRYLMCFSDQAVCATKENLVLPSYIAGYRNNQAYDPSAGYSGFFGSGNKKHRYCENGKVWDGTPGGPAVKLGR